jgi:hypothetical protein
MSEYIIRVEGLLSAGLTSSFPHLTATQHSETLLHGHELSQTELTVVLNHLGSLGVDVIEVHRLPDSSPVPSP